MRKHLAIDIIGLTEMVKATTKQKQKNDSSNNNKCK